MSKISLVFLLTVLSCYPKKSKNDHSKNIDLVERQDKILNNIKDLCLEVEDLPFGLKVVNLVSCGQRSSELQLAVSKRDPGNAKSHSERPVDNQSHTSPSVSRMDKVDAKLLRRESKARDIVLGSVDKTLFNPDNSMKKSLSDTDLKKVESMHKRVRKYSDSFHELLKMTAPLEKVSGKGYFIETEIKTEIGNSKESFDKKVSPIIRADTFISYSIASYKSVVKNLESFPDEATSKLEQKIQTVLNNLKNLRVQVKKTLSHLGEDALVFTLNEGRQYVQLRLLRESLIRSDLNRDEMRGIKDEIDNVLRNPDLYEELRRNPVFRKLQDNFANESQLVIFSRAISNSGLEGQVKGYSSKKLYTKAKSDKRGFIPYSQEFSHKVSKDDKDLFQEFSWFSTVEILADGLPATFPQLFRRKQRHIDSDRDFIAIKSQESSLEWVPNEGYTEQSLVDSGYILYKVHTDPRSMKGVTEAVLREWKEDRKKRGLSIGPSEKYGQPKHLQLGRAPKQDDPGYTAWKQEKQLFHQQQEQLRQEREMQSEYALEQIKDLARFVWAKQGGNQEPSDIDINRLIETAKPVVPDADLLAIGGGNVNLIQRDYQYQPGLGYMSKATKQFFNYASIGSEKLGIQRNVHHGAESDNLDFPQELINDYPISVVTYDGVYRKIEKGPDENPHKHLFDYILKLYNDDGIKVSINPIYILEHQDLFKNIEFTPYQLQDIRNVVQQPQYSRYSEKARELFSSHGHVFE